MVTGCTQSTLRQESGFGRKHLLEAGAVWRMNRIERGHVTSTTVDCFPFPVRRPCGDLELSRAPDSLASADSDGPHFTTLLRPTTC
jgi:hypothetical protein